MTKLRRKLTSRKQKEAKMERTRQSIIKQFKKAVKSETSIIWSFIKDGHRA